MKMQNYFQIKNFCNKILTSNNFKNFKFYYQLLFVLKESPEIMFQYNQLYLKKKNIDNLSKSSKNFSKKLKNYIKIFFLRKKYFFDRVEKQENVDLIIFSHLVDSFSKYKDLEDFYFGKLPEELIKADINFKIIYRNLSNYKRSDTYLNKNYSIVLPNSSGLINEIFILLRCIYYYLIFIYQLKVNFKNTNKDEVKFFSKIKNFFSIINNLRFEYLANYLINELQPNKIITTFEGHAWERILFKIANNNKKNIKVFGYQHTMLTKYFF